MATVYLATDVKHRRNVAIKVIHPELARTLGADRFLREIEIAAQLQHPNILPLHDSCQDQECLFYVMPFVDGESLRQRLLREGTLPLEDAARLTFEIADALSYAHRRGVLHRDIKPENVLLYEGHALVADFGIARAIRTAADSTLTRTGIALGTPGYMSPEQAAGVRDLDARTDVYSLACVFYETLIGEPPGLWVTEESTRLGRFVDASPAHRAELDRLSGSVEQVLVHALALRLADRFATAEAFAAALQCFPERRGNYADTEVRDIIGRAAEIDATAPTEGSKLSIGGIERVAAEAGIPPAAVRQALGQRVRLGRLSVPTSEKVTKALFGASHRIHIERVIAGEVSESAFPSMVDEIRMATGEVGYVSALGRSMAWATTMGGQGSGRNVQVTVTPKAGSTYIVLDERLDNLLGGVFGGLLGGGGGGGAAAVGAVLGKTYHAPELILPAVLLVLGTTYGTARVLYAHTARRKERALSALADRLVDVAESAIRERLPRGVRPPRLNA